MDGLSNSTDRPSKPCAYPKFVKATQFGGSWNIVAPLAISDPLLCDAPGLVSDAFCYQEKIIGSRGVRRGRNQPLA
jgi:hypothetical protein